MLTPELKEELPSLLDKISKLAQEIAEQREQLWPLRESLILLCGHLSQLDTSTAANLRQWLLQRAYQHDESPWLSVASLHAWASFSPASQIEPVLTSLLCSHESQRSQYGQNWPFVYARFAMIAGQHGCWSVLRQACHAQSDSEFMQIEIIRQLTRSSEQTDLDFCVNLSKTPVSHSG